MCQYTVLWFEGVSNIYSYVNCVDYGVVNKVNGTFAFVWKKSLRTLNLMKQYKFAKSKTKWDECVPSDSIWKLSRENDFCCLVPNSGRLIEVWLYFLLKQLCVSSIRVERVWIKANDAVIFREQRNTLHCSLIHWIHQAFHKIRTCPRSNQFLNLDRNPQIELSSSSIC